MHSTYFAVVTIGYGGRAGYRREVGGGGGGYVRTYTDASSMVVDGRHIVVVWCRETSLEKDECALSHGTAAMYFEENRIISLARNATQQREQPVLSFIRRKSHTERLFFFIGCFFPPHYCYNITHFDGTTQQ